MKDCIATLTGDEVFTLAGRAGQLGERCNVANTDLCAVDAVLDPLDPGLDVVATTEELNDVIEVYSVSRPQNGDEATITGFEVAWTNVFVNGFRITANATKVDSDASVGVS